MAWPASSKDCSALATSSSLHSMADLEVESTRVWPEPGDRLFGEAVNASVVHLALALFPN